VIAIIDYGLGNLKSVKYALDRLGVESVLTAEAAEIAEADRVILPGVGAFGRAMELLDQLHLLDVTRAAALSGRPFMGICLGMQLLFSRSDEHGLHQGMGIIPGRVIRFDGDLTVPHMGWNQVTRSGHCAPLFDGIADDSFFYFAHSYYVVPESSDVIVGLTDYGCRYASAVRDGMVWGTQFHPEKSGPIGLAMLSNFCKLRKTKVKPEK